jgi:hypothetical protein|tara:strand:- start:627 stop:1220 length:594 start_codon:yes stop_codon:yes gene_type:complete
MTSREGFDAYQLYLGIKLHFHSKDYDFVKYNGVVKAELPSFMKRKDKFHFGKLSRTYKHELKDFFVANLSHKDYWVGDLLDKEADRRYKEWKKNKQKLTYLFETEVSTLLKTFKIDTILKVDNGQHPRLLKSFMSKKVSLETICIMDAIIGFTEDWDKLITEQVVYPDISNQIKKYKAFIDYDHAKYKTKLIELCST